MLNKKESRVMKVLFGECADKPSALISPVDLMSLAGVTLSEADKIVNDLSQDGYFDLIYSDRHGEKIYCISFTGKGRAYQRDVKIRRRNLVYRLFLTIVFAFISFVVGLVLKAIF